MYWEGKGDGKEEQGGKISKGKDPSMYELLMCEGHSVVSNSLRLHALYKSIEISQPEYCSG